MAEAPFKLSCSLYGHNLDVRCVATTEDGKILTGSRDKTLKVWIPNELGHGYKESRSLDCHTNFVSSVCVLKGSKKHPEGLVVTGCNDNLIRVFNASDSSPCKVLKSHVNTVSKVAGGINEGTILSASWDMTAKVWYLFTSEVVVTLRGHKAAVWSIVQLSSGVIVTASADKTIKVWLVDGTCIQTLTGHTDCVRDIAAKGSNEIISVANDASIRIWNVETGKCTNTLFGHCNFIYSVALPLKDESWFATSSEDKTIKVWRHGELTQSISVPAHSVWSCAILPNGDIVAGSSDGLVHVFSSDVSRHAAPDQLTAFEEQINAFVSSTNQNIGGVKVSDLPGKEVLYEPGKNDGQTKMVREGSTVVAYSWSASEGRWDRVGEVMGSSGTDGSSETGKTTYNGKEYDHVFNVDIEEGKPALKLPFNNGDDPWHAAQRFIHEHNLNQQFLEQVANFIVTNAGIQPAAVSSASYKDPYTGGERYIPGTGAAAAGAAGANNDPFTGASSYSTGGKGSTYFPQRKLLSFDQGNPVVILEKLVEFNEMVGEQQDLRLSRAELEEVVKLCDMEAPCCASVILSLDKLLNWPQAMVFPVLDVMRLAIRNPEVNTYLCTEQLLPSLDRFLEPGSSPANSMLSLRLLSNMMLGSAGLELAQHNRKRLMDILEQLTAPYTKPLQVAMATVLLNLTVVATQSGRDDDRADALGGVGKLLARLSDEEALLRALVALGTVLTEAHCTLVRTAANTCTHIVTNIATDTKAQKLKDCARDVLTLLRNC